MSHAIAAGGRGRFDARAVEDSGTMITAEELDDLALVARAQEGDTRSFETLVRRHQRQLYRLAVRLIGNSGDAEEAAPEAFLELNRSLQDLSIGQMTCWALRELQGLSYEDVAAIVGASPDAVRGRLHRARRTLVEVMTPWR